MNLRFYSTILFVAIASSGFAQQAMSLKDCINWGLQQNLKIKRAQMDLSNNRARVLEGVSAYLPQIQAMGTGVDNLQLQTMMMPPEFGALAGQPGVSLPVKFGKQFNSNGQIQGQQTLYDQTYISSIQAARESNKIFKTQIIKSEEEVIYDIATVFYQLQITAEQKKLVEANLSRISELANVTKVSLDNGFSKQTDYNRLVVTKANLETDLQNVMLGYNQQLMLLKFHMGMPLDQPIQLVTNNSPDVQSSLLSAEKFSPENNVDVKLLQTNRKVNKILRSATLAGYAPSISFNANYGQLYQADDLKFAKANWTPFSSIGLKVTVPIFDGLNKHWKAQQQKIQLQQLEIDEKLLKESLQMQNRNAQDKLSTNTAAVKSQNRNMELAEDVYKTTQLSYQQGMASLSDLLNAETSLKESQVNYLNAMVQLKLAELEILKTSGNIRSILN